MIGTQVGWNSTCTVPQNWFRVSFALPTAAVLHGDKYFDLLGEAIASSNSLLIPSPSTQWQQTYKVYTQRRYTYTILKISPLGFPCCISWLCFVGVSCSVVFDLFGGAIAFMNWLGSSTQRQQMYKVYTLCRLHSDYSKYLTIGSPRLHRFYVLLCSFLCFLL